jgi:hypothetical protein
MDIISSIKKADKKTTFNLKYVIVILMILSFSSLNVLGGYNILKVDIEVSKNPIDCGDEAVVDVTIHLERGDDIPGYGDLRVGLVEDDGPNASILDIESLWNPGLIEGENHVSFTVKCQIKEAGCQLWGPRGNSDESGAWVFAYVYGAGKKSSKIYVQCKQIVKDGEISMNGSDSAVVGDKTSVTMSAVEPINNVLSADWGISYDSSIFEVISVQFINPILYDLFNQGFLIYEDKSGENKIDFSLFPIFEPIILDGEIVIIELLTKNDTTKYWQETFIKCTEDSVFYSEFDDELDVCKGDNHSIFIIPFDTSEPEIDVSQIEFSQGLINGLLGAITDENFGYLNDYLIVSLYDENDDLVAEDVVNQDGSFELGPYFWLNDETNSTLSVTNGASLISSYSFMPSQSSLSYVYALNDTTGAPFENITVEFYIQGRSDISETYDITISDLNNWEYDQKSFQIILGAMEERILKINTSIPKNAENGSTNTITLTMIPKSNPDYSDSKSLNVNVLGEYKEPSGEAKETEETPGFELISVLFLIFLILYWKRKKI